MLRQRLELCHSTRVRPVSNARALLHTNSHVGLNQELKYRYKARGILTTSVHPNWIRTPLIESWEKALHARGDPIIEPQVVADLIVKQIISASSGQIYVPHTLGRIGLLRGFPNWLQELIRDGTSKAVLSSAELELQSKVGKHIE